jgi:hypothetical protein
MMAETKLVTFFENILHPMAISINDNSSLHETPIKTDLSTPALKGCRKTHSYFITPPKNRVGQINLEIDDN